MIQNLSKSKIGYFQVPILIHHYVLGFQISVEQTAMMHVFQSQKNLGSIETSLLFSELSHSKINAYVIDQFLSLTIDHLLSVIGEELSAANKRKYEIQTVEILVGSY